MKKKDAFGDLPELNFIWKDRKRFLGMPLSFTRYRLSADRFFVEKGFFSTKCDETLLYRVRDISVSLTLGQKIFGVGTVTLDTTDKSMPVIIVKNIKKPRQVKELIHRQVEKAKAAYRVRVNELMGDPDSDGYDSDGDGIPDAFDVD